MIGNYAWIIRLIFFSYRQVRSKKNFKIIGNNFMKKDFTQIAFLVKTLAIAAIYTSIMVVIIYYKNCDYNDDFRDSMGFASH